MPQNSYFSPSIQSEILEYFWDDLQKASRNVGDINPANPNQVWDKMSNGVMAWRKNNHHSLSDDNFIKNAWPQFAAKFPQKSQATLSKLRDHVLSDPDRHFIPTQRDINAPQHFLRARHLISLLSGDPSVNLKGDNNTLTFRAHRHPPGGKIFTSHWEYSPNGVKYRQTEGHEKFEVPMGAANQAPEVNKQPATKVSQGVMVRRAGANKSEDNPEGIDLPIIRGGTGEYNRKSSENATLHDVSKGEGNNLQPSRLSMDSVEPTSINQTTGSSSSDSYEDVEIPDGSLWTILSKSELTHSYIDNCVNIGKNNCRLTRIGNASDWDRMTTQESIPISKEKFLRHTGDSNIASVAINFGAHPQHGFVWAEVPHGTGTKHHYYFANTDQGAASVLGKNEPLEKASKNVRLQRKKVFGTQSSPPLKSTMRGKHIDHLKNFADKFLGLELHPSGGKVDDKTGERRDADAEIGVDKPDWRSGRLESQWNPDAIVHELAHLLILPEGIGLEEGQRLMDKQYGDVQKQYGYMQQKRSQHEVQPMAAENIIRRYLGLPATRVGIPVKDKNAPQRTSVEDPTQVIATRIPKGENYFDLIRQSRNLSPQNKQRLEDVFSGKIKFNPDLGWIPSNTIDSKISTREPGYFGEQAAARQAPNVTPMANRVARMKARRGGVGSTSKHTPYKTLENIKRDNYVGAGGQEYDSADLNDELQQRKQAAADKIASKPIPFESDKNRSNYTPEFMSYITSSNPKRRVVGKSEDLSKAPLSYDEANMADAWSENPTFEKRNQLHIVMMHPSHKEDRAKMIKALSKDAKIKKINDQWHIQLYRGIGPGEHPEDFKQDPRSYTYNPKVAKKFADEYGGTVVKQWIPLQHISYSFNHAHEVGGNEPYHGDESEVLVGPLHDYKKNLKKTEHYEVLKKFKKNSVCTMFMFDGVDHPDVLHVTHKYFSDSLTEEAKEQMLDMLKDYFKRNPFKEINTTFDKVEYFGEDKDVKVLRPKNDKLFLNDLKEKLDEFKPDKYPEYKPHATVNSNMNEIKIPIIDYVVIDGGDVIFRASDLDKSEPLMKPYRSDAQRRWAHTSAGKKALGGDKAVAHWDAETKGRHLPEKLDKEELVHFSNIPNLQILDPNKMGTSMVGGMQYKRGVPENRSTFYYTSNSVPEEQVLRNSKHKYTVNLPTEHRIYDFDKDPENLAHEARVLNNGAWNEDIFHGLLKQKGYHGVRWQMSPETTVVQHYHPLPATSSHLIKKESEADAETEQIKKNKMKPEAGRTHKFKSAKWTHPNGHPRCFLCGQEEPVGGMCSPVKKTEYLYKNFDPATGNRIRGIADQYAANAGLNIQHNLEPVKVNKDRAGKIAQAYHEMKHDPNHPAVKSAYNALINETNSQFQHLKNSGMKFSKIKPGMDNPYPNGSKDVFRDLHENNHLWYFPTESGYGNDATQNVNDHPLLQTTSHVDDEGKPMLANDVFRVVHDVFGHAKEGFGFGPNGEENAWRHHMQMYSPEAQKALTAETRGQNSWVNFGPHGEQNRANPANTIYADQKAGLLPDWAMDQSEHVIHKSEETLAPIKALLESPKEIEHIDMPESLVLQWSIPLHRYEGNK